MGYAYQSWIIIIIVVITIIPIISIKLLSVWNHIE